MVADDPEIVIDYDFENILPQDMATARALFETIGEVIGRSTRATISLKSNFFELGGNSLNSIYTVAKLRTRGYSIEISQFISAKSLGDMMAYINRFGAASDALEASAAQKNSQFMAFSLSDEHKDDTLQ